MLSLCDSLDGSYLRDLVARLVDVPHLRVWAAGIKTRDIPDCLQRQELRLALRAAPRLVEEVQAGFDGYDGDVLPYAAGPGLHAPTDGPAVTTVLHTPGRDGHDAGRDPRACRRCGELTAAILLRLRQGESRLAREGVGEVGGGDSVSAC